MLCVILPWSSVLPGAALCARVNPEGVFMWACMTGLRHPPTADEAAYANRAHMTSKSEPQVARVIHPGLQLRVHECTCWA